MRPTRPTRVALTLALSLAAGCAAGPPVARRPRFDPSMITRSQIQELQVATAYDAVKTLRSNWLNVRGNESFRYPTAVQVYLDGVHVGDASTLQNIATLPIQYIRYFSGQEATAKWGIDHGRGAIWISTKVSRTDGAEPPAGDG